MPKLDESLLTHVPAFSQLERAQIREILGQATTRRVDEGKPIFQEGADATHFYLLLDGYIRVMRITDDGGEVIMLHIPSGELVGFAQAIGRTTYPATAMAAAECILLSWPSRLWPGFVETYPGFGTETYRTIGARMGEMNTRIVDLATLHVEQRVAKALLRLINQTGRKTTVGIEIDFPITRQDVSEMTGTTLHTVSRLLSGWQKSGIVKSERKRITVTQPHELVVLSEAALSH